MLSPIGEAMFPYLFKVSDKSGKYDVVIRFEKPSSYTGKNKQAWGEMVAAAKKIAEDEFDGKPLSEIPNPFREGDANHKYFDDPDSIYIRFGTTTRPSFVGPNPKVNLDSGECYGGMLGRASFNAKSYDVKGNRGITFYLNNFQKTGDGERKGAERVEAEDEFDNVEEDVAADLFS